MKFLPQILKLADNNVTVALSMGADSVAIAHFLKTKYPKIQLRAFHYNHALREQNHEMLSAAFRFCNTFNIELKWEARDVTLQTKLSESNLRALRYKAMAGLGHVITGHHLDDACENYMFNCLNGVPEYLPIPLVTEYKDFNLTVIRPFINNSKAVFEEYIEKNDLTQFVVVDETNTDEMYRRNWLRNNILPQIAEKGFGLEKIVWKRYDKYIKENF
jgi:tRNA(Ile)-lysidine synthase